MADKNKETALGKAFVAAVKQAIAGDKDHGWGAQDSLEVIETLIAEDGPNGYAPSEELMALIAQVVNPSAFRQQAEKQGLLNKSEKNERRASSLKGMLEQYS